MIGKTNVGGGKQAKLADIDNFTGVQLSTDYGEDFAVTVLNGVYADYPVTFELYRDNVLLTPSQPYGFTIRNTRVDYKDDITSYLKLREAGLGVRGEHSYKMRVICDGFEGSNFTSSVTHTMSAIPPILNLSGDTLTISSSDTFTDQYKIYADDVLKTTINKTGNTQTFDLRTLNLSNGSHSIIVKGVGEGINEGRASLSVTYVVSTGYNITVNLTADDSGETMMTALIKLNSAPLSESDYDYYYSGHVQDYDTNIPEAIVATKVYIWGEEGQITSPVTEELYPSHTTYNTAKEITYSADGTLGLHFYYDT